MPQLVHSQTPTVQISVINRSTVLTDAEVSPVVSALQKQVTDHFLPAWGVTAGLNFVASNADPTPGTWWLSILDDSDQAGALGYHDVTPDGLPLGKVFAATDLKFGSLWSVTASHELLEMLADPNINLTVFVQNDDTSGTLYAYEVCDACEADDLAYDIDGTKVSDFVYPAWFESFRAQNSTQFDYRKKIQNPLQLVAGGYIGVFDVTAGGGWQQKTEQRRPDNIQHRGNVGSRRERRSVPHPLWVPSLPHREITQRAEKYRQLLRTILDRAA
jgi:Fe-S cluster assembly iron-binding protein IscA